MVVLSLRNRQNRECVDEDLRANKKVFERLQQQIAIMPQSELPPNEKLQAIAFQFNKDIENVKNALNDGLTDMNTPDAVQRGFADFSKVSLAWNKLVARVNPYLKGQQTDPDFQAATAGDYNYVRQKLRDDLLQFFANAIQQINSFKDGIAAQGGVARVQNEASLDDIFQQLSTGFYKNVRYGAEARTSLLIPRLPPDVVQQGQPAGQPPQPLPQPQAAPAQPIPQPQGQVQLNQQDIDDMEDWEAQNGDIDAANFDRAVAEIEDGRFQEEVAQQGVGDQPPTEQMRQAVRDQLQNDLIPQYVIYRDQQRQQQGQQAQPARRPPLQPLDPAAVQAALDAARQQGTPARRGRPEDVNRQQAIFDKAQELGLYERLRGYSQKNPQEKRQLAAAVQQLAASLRITPEALKRNLNRMAGFGRRSKGGFLGSILGDVVSGLAGDAFRGATGMSPFEAAKGLVKGAYENRGAIANLAKGAFNNFMTKHGGARREGARGRPLRLANDFTGTQVVPNTLAELKNRYKGKSYIGTMTGDIDPTLQNSSVLGSARNRRMEGEGVAEVLAAISRMSRSAVENILFPAFNALGQAIAQGVRVGREIPPHVRRILETTRGVYRREDVQTILSYLKSHPDVLIPFLPTPYAVAAVAARLFQHYLNLPPAQTGTEPRVGREMGQREEDDYVIGDGSGRCCFNSGMCNGTKAYRFKYGEKSANVRKESVRGRGGSMEGGGNGVNINVKYAKLPKALQPTEEDLNPTPRPRSSSGGVRRPRMPKESYEGFQDEENDVYTHRGGIQDSMPLLHTEMLQDKTLGLLKGLPRRLGVEDPKHKAPKM